MNESERSETLSQGQDAETSTSTVSGKRRHSTRLSLGLDQSPSVSYKVNRRDVKEEDKDSCTCDKLCCSGIQPKCFLGLSEKCIDTGNKGSWRHISTGEHYCGHCQGYFSKRESPGVIEYQSWKNVWLTYSNTEPNARLFLAECYMPWWLKCTACEKWREVPRDVDVTPSFIDSFHCPLLKDSKSSVNNCSFEEDERAMGSLESKWIEVLALPALLQRSPAMKFFHKEKEWYYLDGIGSSPVFSADDCYDEEGSEHHFLKPFRSFKDSMEKALCLRPDVMEYDEILEFAEYAREQRMYLGLRNLIVALWNLNPKKFVDINSCSRYIICRGLTRIRAIYEADKILSFLSRKGVINTGLLHSPERPLLLGQQEKLKIVIVGAGIAGLAAARQLKNFGQEVVVLEARNRIGGRIWDSCELGSVVGLGAHLVTGLMNNPVTLMCHQANIKLHPLTEKCPLIKEDGQFVDIKVDKKVDFHFNALLDAAGNWRKTVSSAQDEGLEEKLDQMHEAFIAQAGATFSEDDIRLLDFHRSNLEYSCGTSLSNVSSINWDQNEQFLQFTGPHALMVDGYYPLVEHLAAGLDIRQGHEVQTVDYSGEQVRVAFKTATDNSEDQSSAKDEEQETTNSDTTFILCDKQDHIEFAPNLPPVKTNAISRIGSGLIEKVAVRFPTRFWLKRVEDADYFGHVPSKSDMKGFFSIFYDLSLNRKSRNKDAEGVLMAYLSGDATKLVREHSDKEVVDIFISSLKAMFPEEDVPEPLGYLVTHWSEDKFAGMSYSYMRVGATGKDYDDLASDVESKVFFAGEATNRHFPQTITGAYLTGIREAGKIVGRPEANKL